MTDIAVQTTGLTKAFKDTPVLKGVDLSVRRGEIFALLGSNGAGKKTTVNILATLLKPDGGSASVGGFDTAGQPDQVRENISLAGQFAAVDGILTGRENLVLVARLRAAPHPREVADILLGQFGLTDAADRRVDTYSGGMARRLDIAMSLVGTPAVISSTSRRPAWTPRAARSLENHQETRRGRHDDPFDHPIPRRGGTARGSDRDPARRANHRRRNPARTQTAPPAREGRIHREATDPGGNLPTHRRHETRGSRSMKAPQNTVILFGRSMRHIQRSPDTIITVAIVPIMLMLLFVYVFGGAIHAGHRRLRRLPAARHPADRHRQRHLVHPVRIFNDPADRDRRPTAFYARGPVIGAVGARDDLAGVQRDHAGLGHPDRPADGLPDRRRPGRLARRGRHPGAVHPGTDLAGGHPRADREIHRRRLPVRLP